MSAVFRLAVAKGLSAALGLILTLGPSLARASDSGSAATSESVAAPMGLDVFRLRLVASNGLEPAPTSSDEEPVDAETAQLKQLYDDAHVAFLAGRYLDAASLFDEGFARSQLAAFLFNSAVAWERAQRIEQAIERYAQYLVKAPQADDRDEITERLDALRKSLAGQTDAEVKQVQTKGVAIITTKPRNSELRIDDPNGPVFAMAPFRGTLPAGEHVLHVSARGFKPESRAFPDNQGKYLIGHFSLSEEYFLGHLEIKSTLAGADVFLRQLSDQDGKPVPAKVDAETVPVGTTPFANQLPPGKWEVRVEKLGYEPYKGEVEIPLGKVEILSVDPKLITTALLRLRAKTPATIRAVAFLEGDEETPLCTLPCEAELPPGEHTILVKKEKKKTLSFGVNVRRADMVTVDVSMEPKTKRVPAIVTGVLMAGAAATGTIFALRARDTRDAMQADLDTFVQTDLDDPRAADGKRDAFVADGCFLGAAVLGSLTLYYILRETGEPSQGQKEQQNLADLMPAVAPIIGPNTYGLAGELRF